MDWKIKILSFAAIWLVSSAALASGSASCTMNGTWGHKAGAPGQVCLSYVCCSNGSKTGWTAGIARDAAGWCRRWGAKPDASCNEQSQEVYNNMTLTAMAQKSGAAGGYPAAQVQCRFDKECDGE